MIEHHRGNFLRLHRSADPLLTDFPILAKNATKVAPTKEDRTRAVPVSEHMLFSVVRAEAVNHGPLAGAADSSVDCNQAIHMAIPGAQVTSLEVMKRLVHPFVELTGSKEL